MSIAYHLFASSDIFHDSYTLSTIFFWCSLNYDELELQRLLPGALVQFDGSFHVVSDPFRSPFLASQGLFSPVGSLVDKLNVLRLRSHLLSRTPDELLKELSGETTLSFLQSFGFSSSMIERFFTPFYQGIFLAPLSEQSASMFAYVFHMFATAPASLPKRGIGAVSDQLAAALPDNVHVELDRTVSLFGDGTLQFSSPEDDTIRKASAPAIVIATDGPSAARLLGSDIETNTSRGSICVYFTSSRAPPIDRPILALNGAASNPDVTVNNMFVPSAVCPSFAPPGRTLISTTVVGAEKGMSNEELEEKVRHEMSSWYGQDVVDEWEMLRIYRIPHSQSAQNPDYVFKRDVQLKDGLFVCGDHRNAPTVNGALQSGCEAAEKVLTYLQK